jgi:hypothetical protein
MTYRIEFLDDVGWAYANEDEGNDGSTRTTQGLIRIRIPSRADENYLRTNLLHEVLHCVWWMGGAHAGLDTVEDKEEYVITTLSPTLLWVMQSNPVLCAYLASTEQDMDEDDVDIVFEEDDEDDDDE